ncbi:hypothetical protein RTE01_02910 [Raoultella terrigena]|uniref:Uncharacterized protein conserved in bacteria n=1 Tax=Raoultella terrigena TaxID=577 RepID=A0A485BK61_RAOTE|nr:hypothetical protein RTE01_02910 [Raoultella terrigena]VFS72633.1 Uncharacterized protein conserved in bacteria [Raoultella terrigena]
MKSDDQLNLRAKESQRALIDTPAEILHKSRTDFILEMACQAVENVTLDRRVFNFNDQQYAEFIDMLDAPVADEPAIERLLKRKLVISWLFFPPSKQRLAFRINMANCVRNKPS